MRLDERSPLVVVASLESSPPASYDRSKRRPCLCPYDKWGQVNPGAQPSAPRVQWAVYAMPMLGFSRFRFNLFPDFVRIL